MFSPSSLLHRWVRGSLPYRGMALLVLGLVLLNPLPGFAEFLDGVSDYPEVAYYPEPDSFVGPNETSQAEGASLLSAAPRGVQVAVGTERGFIGAALNKNATHLLLLDRDLDAVRFNRINIELLRIARSRPDYLSLRFARDRQAWVHAGVPASSSLSEEDFKFWKDCLAHPDFSSFHVAASRPEQPFRGANYLHDDGLFDRVAALARAGRIRSIQVNLEDTPRLKRISEALQSEHLKVGVLDISNAWWPRYLGRAGFVRMLQDLAPTMDERSLLMMTEKVMDPESRWTYFSARPGEIRSGPALAAFYDELQEFHKSGEWPGGGLKAGEQPESPPIGAPLGCFLSLLNKRD